MSSSAEINPQMVVTPEALQQLAAQLATEPVIAVDLEMDSLHHYTEQVCLLQISAGFGNAIVDPLAVRDLSPLAPVLASSASLKLFHGADYDVRSLHRDFGLKVGRLFDTMVASQLLGEAEIGLAAQLRKRFGVELDKRYQKADWSQRPLPAEMIRYAAMDTAFLVAFYEQLVAELRQKGRLAWVEEECVQLCQVRMLARDEDGPLFVRCKGANKLNPRQLAVLEELLQLRDRQARLRDRPPFKVLGSETLLLIAQRQPKELAELQGIAGLTPRLLERYGRELLAAVRAGEAVPGTELPGFPKRPRTERDPAAGERLKRLKTWRNELATRYGLEPGILVNNAQLEALAQSGGPPPETVLKEWQWREFGRELAAQIGEG